MHNSMADASALSVAQLVVRVDKLEQARTEDANRANRLEDKIDALRGWLIGILASSLGSVLLGLLFYLLPVRK